MTSSDPLLPKPPGLLRRWLSEHELVVDAGVALVALALQYPIAWGADGLGTKGDPLLHGTWPILLAGCAILVLRRRHPLVTTTVVGALGVVLAVLDQPYLLIAGMFAVYAVAVYGSARAAWTALGSIVLAYIIGYGTSQVVVRGDDVWSGVQGVIGILLFLTVAVLVGVNIGNRKRYLDALLERAAQLARERDQQGQLATAAERARIAREMHDVVAHSLSVMVRLADGADAVVELDPERSRDAVRQIGSVGRESLRDMRRLLGVLRDDDATALAPQPTLDELDRLIETYRGAGLPVAIQRTGATPTDSALQVAVFRTVQEGLTNALRYATEPSRVLVQLTFGADQTEVDVTDDGMFVGPKPSMGTGRGLLGLRERAAVFGGGVEAGAIRADGSGWRVHVSLHHHREDRS